MKQQSLNLVKYLVHFIIYYFLYKVLREQYLEQIFGRYVGRSFHETINFPLCSQDRHVTVKTACFITLVIDDRRKILKENTVSSQRYSEF